MDSLFFTFSRFFGALLRDLGALHIDLIDVFRGIRQHRHLVGLHFGHAPSHGKYLLLAGTAQAQGVIITDTLPVSTTFLGCSQACANPGVGNTGVVTWSLGNRDPGAAGTVTSNLRAMDVNVAAVGVIGDDGEQVGILPTREALQMAQERGLDLVEVSPPYDTSGNTAVAVQKVTVTEDTMISANFNGTPAIGVAPLTVQFNDLSTGSPTNWNWSFGDGSTSLVQNPVHVYSRPGDYTVSLTVMTA